jgi:hypothetical protein
VGAIIALEVKDVGLSKLLALLFLCKELSNAWNYVQ